MVSQLFSWIRKFHDATIASTARRFPSIYDQWAILSYAGNYSSWYHDGRYRKSQDLLKDNFFLYLIPREERNWKKRLRQVRLITINPARFHVNLIVRMEGRVLWETGSPERVAFLERI